VPVLVQQQVTARATELLARKFKIHPEYQAAARRHGFNYVVAVFGEWRGRSYYLCARYRTSRGTPEDEFVVRATRLAYTDLGRFDLAYFRHTNRWQPVYSGLTVSECFETIEREEVFWPMT
jgi:hypothetical protein